MVVVFAGQGSSLKHLLAALFVLVPCSALAFPAHFVSCHDGDTCRLEIGQGIIKA